MIKYFSLLIALIVSSSMVSAQETIDSRQNVEMPLQMKQMFLKNMRGHMEALDQIIASLAAEDLSAAADIAETALGLGHGVARQCDDNDKSHKQSAMDKNHKGFGLFMPSEMKVMGMGLHHAANEFATVAREGNMGEAYKALRQVSASCIACHRSFRVQ